MDLLRQFVDIFLHLDQHLRDLVQTLGPWTYALLFVVIFAETGLVFIPFLPGDSLLFATGAVIAIEGTGLNIWIMMALLFIAAVLGDAANYAFGRYVGPKVFREDGGWLFNKEHLMRTKKFYDRHGGKTIIIARFIPIVRTFAPFVAGIGHMNYLRFASYNIVGAFFWVFPFVILGYFFGNLPAVQSNFHYVIFGIILLSVMPIIVEFWKARVEAKKTCKA